MEMRVIKTYVEQECFDTMYNDLIEFFYQYKILPLEINYNFIKNSFEYTLYSPYFDIVKYGHEAPFYSIGAIKEKYKDKI